MAQALTWLFVFLLLYWGFCIYWGATCARGARTASEFFVAGRRLPVWAFITAATATSFGAWSFLAQPGLVFRDGIQVVFAGLCAITIPLTGVVFLKRQWMLSKRFGYLTPGELFADYYQGDGIRWLALGIALVFAVPFVALLLGASGFVFGVVTDGWISRDLAVWLLAIVPVIYVTAGGLRAVANVSTLQALLLVMGMLIVGLIALVFAVPFVALLLGASGFVFGVVTDGWISRDLAVWLLAIVLVIYVTAGGLRAVANVSTLQALLLVMGMLIVGLIALNLAGGFEALNRGLADLAALEPGPWGRTRGYGGGDYSAGFAIPGVAQWTAGLGRETPVGGLWTGVMCLSFMFAFMGIQSAPAFSLWAFASESPRAFAPQHVWASALVIGFVLVFFVSIQGVGAYLLGASSAATEAGVAVAAVLPPLTSDHGVLLVPYYIRTVASAAPWLVGFLLVCALAATQSTAAVYLNAAGTLLARDLYRRHVNASAPHRSQILFARLSILVVAVLALLLATYARDALPVLGGFALALGFQLWPALLGVTWWPWLTRQGVTAGLLAGILAVVLTDSIGQKLTGNTLPWGIWPWTIHSAAWGMLFNLLICVIASGLSRDARAREHRMKFHAFLREHAGRAPGRRPLRTTAWIVTIVWLFFGVGPGIVIGNALFGEPGAGHAAWDFGMPSLWVWVVLWWGIGVVVLWFLAYKMELSTAPAKPVITLSEDAGPAAATDSGPS